jgi:hypothetical protein
VYYIIYKVTNTVNNKIYIGKHKTDNLDDGYLGSGNLIKRSIEKYGVDKFQKEILYIFDNEDDLNEMESRIVDKEFILREDTYNLKIGGSGGWDYVNHNNLSTGTQHINSNGLNNICGQCYIHIDRIKNSIEYKLENIKKIQEGLKRYYEDGGVAPFYGKSHTKESRQKMSQKAKLRVGQKNSQFGTCWIYKESEKANKKVKKDDLKSWLDDGWTKGRKKFN